MKKYNLINNIAGWVCFAIAAVTYLLTIEPTASFWDCPEFTAQGAKLEVGHPPGNPIFMLTARFFITITGSDITNAAVVINCMSALLSAATILLLFWTITYMAFRLLVDDKAKEMPGWKIALIMAAGACGALAYTWSDTFWFSAVESEVYAFSSFCTALVFWLILKWDNHCNEPHSDRYLVLIAYVIGVSIAVHLLNLLCIPAIVLVFYYRKTKEPSALGSLIALGISFVIVAAILYGLVPGIIGIAQKFELFCVNTLGWGFNSGAILYAATIVAVFAVTIYLLYHFQLVRAQRDAKRTKELGGWVKLMVFLSVTISGLTYIGANGLIWWLLTIALAIYLFTLSPAKLPVRVFNVAILSIFVIFIGYSSYALLLIRASANTPMNQNAPDNVFALASYLNREQYGQRPLLYGPTFADVPQIAKTDQGYAFYMDENGLPIVESIGMSDALHYRADLKPDIDYDKTYTKAVKFKPTDKDRYVDSVETPNYNLSPDLNMLFTRIYSMDPEHVKGYKSWSGYTNSDIASIAANAPASKRQEWAQRGYAMMYELAPYMSNLSDMSIIDSDEYEPLKVWKPSFVDNLNYFFNYQLVHMYWRYFMWNFAGRQNDYQGNGEPNLGNWISGIPFIDNMRLGDQSLLPDQYGKGNKGHNVFYMLPLILGLLGLIWQSLSHHRYAPDRGIEQFWVVFFLFFMTGIAIVLYLNQTPGQPRERDYAFAGSFYAFAIWIGLGVPAIYQWLSAAFKPAKAKANVANGATANISDASADGMSVPALCVAIAFAAFVPLQMVSQTWDDHDRSHRYTTRDFGANYLNSLEPNAIIFTNGDNDTFPLWYAQEVEGIRTDARVVNLSYLATDWYANQMKHPYYYDNAIPFLAEPYNYAYDMLAYSSSARDADDTPVPALEGLKQFYSQRDNMLNTPRMFIPIDTVAMAERFGLNPESPDSTYLYPYLGNIAMNGLSGGFTLSKLLSFDMIANSADANFDRPVYFATTVPSSYYLGLQPYMYSTGVAMQVTPFANALSSPVADKAYENIMSKFRWGGLDDPEHNQGLYLDETVRRMVATMRNAVIDIALELNVRGSEPATEWAVEWAKQNGLEVPKTKYDMARQLLYLMEEKMPYEAAPYDNLTDLTAIEQYLNLYANTHDVRDLDRAERMIDRSIDRYVQLTKYAASLPSRSVLGSNDRYQVKYLPILMGYKEYINLMRKSMAASNMEQASKLIDTVNSDLTIGNAIYLFNLVYLEDATAEEYDELATAYAETDIAPLAEQAAALMRLSESLGIDPSQSIAKQAEEIGIDMPTLRRMNPNPLLGYE